MKSTIIIYLVTRSISHSIENCWNTDELFLQIFEITSAIDPQIFIQKYLKLLSIQYEWITKHEKPTGHCQNIAEPDISFWHRLTWN